MGGAPPAAAALARMAPPATMPGPVSSTSAARIQTGVNGAYAPAVTPQISAIVCTVAATTACGSSRPAATFAVI